MGAGRQSIGRETQLADQIREYLAWTRFSIPSSRTPASSARTRRRSIASISRSRTARSRGLRPTFRPARRNRSSTPRTGWRFPGCVDAHMHIGIYAPLAQDAVSESKAAAMGGVTSSLNYIRTGHYYLNRGGPYREFMPEVHKQAEGQVLGRLRLSHCADRSRAYRRDGASGHRSRRDVVQDLHVLRRLRAARRLVAAERVSDDRAGRALRHRAFRVHHARRRSA